MGRGSLDGGEGERSPGQHSILPKVNTPPTEDALRGIFRGFLGLRIYRKYAPGAERGSMSVFRGLLKKKGGLSFSRMGWKF